MTWTFATLSVCVPVFVWFGYCSLWMHMCADSTVFFFLPLTLKTFLSVSPLPHTQTHSYQFGPPGGSSIPGWAEAHSITHLAAHAQTEHHLRAGSLRAGSERWAISQSKGEHKHTHICTNVDLLIYLLNLLISCSVRKTLSIVFTLAMRATRDRLELIMHWNNEETGTLVRSAFPSLYKDSKYKSMKNVLW